MDPKTYALRALNQWYQAAPIYLAGKSAGWAQTLDYYTTGRNVNFLRDFGNAVRTANSTKVESAMKQLAKDFGDRYPDKTEFFNYLAKYVGTLSSSEIAGAAAQGVKDAAKAAGDVAKSSLMVYAAIAAIGVFILPAIFKELGKKGGKVIA